MKGTGAVFTKANSQLKPKTWLRPFVNAAPGVKFKAMSKALQ